MSIINLQYDEFCYMISYFGIVFASGEAGFITCFYGVEYDNAFYDACAWVDCVTIFVASILVALGTYNETNLLVVIHLILNLICQTMFWGTLIYSLCNKPKLMHYEFIMPLVFWKIFQLYGLFYLYWYNNEL